MIQAVVYCDASVKESFCGIGVCLLDNNGKLVEKLSRRIRGVAKNNNTEAESIAIIEGIKLARDRGFKTIRVYSDSKTLVQASRKGSGKSKVAKKFIIALKSLKEFVTFTLRWVRGHSGQVWNCMCDRLARGAKWGLRDGIAEACSKMSSWLSAPFNKPQNKNSWNLNQMQPG